MKCFRILFATTLFAASFATAQQTSKNDSQVEAGLAKFPDVDANKDGILTTEEARTFLSKRQLGGRFSLPKPHMALFEPSDDELAATIRLGREEGKGGPLQFEKGKGLRIVMTGHSWVAPGRTSLLKIAEGAGLDGHQQRHHSGGGATGSANAIWLKEFGKWKKGVEADPVLIPAIATGEWDVMTWGSYYNDKPEYYTQWIDFCLKYNPEMNFYAQGGWPRFLPEYKTKTPEEILKKMTALQASDLEEIYRPRYEPLEKLYPGKFRMIPTSFAVVDLIGQFYNGDLPNLDCVDEKSSGGKSGIYRDGGHLSRTSGIGHLVGYIYYGMVYRKSPALIENYTPENIPPEVRSENARSRLESDRRSPSCTR